MHRMEETRAPTRVSRCDAPNNTEEDTRPRPRPPLVIWNHPAVDWRPQPLVGEDDVGATLERDRHVVAAMAYRELLRAQLAAPPMIP